MTSPLTFTETLATLQGLLGERVSVYITEFKQRCPVAFMRGPLARTVEPFAGVEGCSGDSVAAFRVGDGESADGACFLLARDAFTRAELSDEGGDAFPHMLSITLGDLFVMVGRHEAR